MVVIDRAFVTEVIEVVSNLMALWFPNVCKWMFMLIMIHIWLEPVVEQYMGRLVATIWFRCTACLVVHLCGACYYQVVLHEYVGLLPEYPWVYALTAIADSVFVPVMCMCALSTLRNIRVLNRIFQTIVMHRNMCIYNQCVS